MMVKSPYFFVLAITKQSLSLVHTKGLCCYIVIQNMDKTRQGVQFRLYCKVINCSNIFLSKKVEITLTLGNLGSLRVTKDVSLALNI